jgi:hypothetical protein
MDHMGVQICSQCGKPFDGDQCWVCVARLEDIKETAYLCLIASGVGWAGTMIAIVLYPPLGGGTPALLLGPVIIIVPGAIVLVLMNYDRLERYAIPVRLMFVLVAAAAVMLAAFYFLNGALDGNPPVEAEALVLSKGVSYTGKYGASYVVELSVVWNRKRIEEGVSASRETFSVIEPGDSVRLAVHPGAFSTPWYGTGLLSNGQDTIRFNSR